MVPLLPLLFPLDPVETVVTSLFVVMVTVFINNISFVRKKLVNWPLFFDLSLGTVVFSSLFSYISVQLEHMIFRLGLLLVLCMVLFMILFNPCLTFISERAS